jgi:cobalamin biosynthetic protein CobC
MARFAGHGGRLDAAMQAWPDAPGPWIDLSTGINPRPYPAPRASRAARSRLPYGSEIAALEAVAAKAFGLDDPARVLATAGAEAGLRLLPQALGRRVVQIVGPTYSGHAAAWLLADARLVDVEDEAGAVVVVNPNNPDGRLHQRAELLALADRLAARGGWLVVDESFADSFDEPSIATAGYPRIVALRSFGKFHGLAGLRLGFVLGDPALIRRLRAWQGDWPVSADAIAAGLAAYADPAWTIRIRARLMREAGRLDKALRAAGFDIVGGTPLFRLAKAHDADARFDALCAHGILTRPFDDDPTWLRFGLPPSWAWARVDEALRGLG